MNTHINLESKANIFQKAVKHGLIKAEDSAVIFYDLDYFQEKIAQLKKHFPENTTHAIAIKANPLIEILKKIHSLDAGVEAATLPEFYLAYKAGFRADEIIFDSPVKTVADLEKVISANVHINADNFDELGRIAGILESRKTSSTFGLRVNPQIGSGTIAATSVAGDYSKFGVPLNEYRDEIIDAYKKHNWLTGIHLHIGSQGIPLDMLVGGVKTIYDLTEKINAELESQAATNRITYFDIGGGLPAVYRETDPAITIERYASALRAAIPGLFDGRYKLITEFGRHIHAGAGWAVSTVEYVKKQGDINTAMIHLGADMFIRKCYNPDDWYHEISVIDSHGAVKGGTNARYNIAGPLCFAGDIIARELELPKITAGDYLIIHDIGAYTFGMWSRYNSRLMPQVIGYSDNGDSFEVLKMRESLEGVYNFWKRG